jgi:hypothetical protein
MKTKLTLTVKSSVIELAKRKAKSKGISVSQMFEKMFEDEGENIFKTESQKAAERLLEKLAKSETTSDFDDKTLIKEHVKRKFA